MERRLDRNTQTGRQARMEGERATVLEGRGQGGSLGSGRTLTKESWERNAKVEAIGKSRSRSHRLNCAWALDRVAYTPPVEICAILLVDAADTLEQVWEDKGLVANPSFQSLKGSAKLQRLHINARMPQQAGRLARSFHHEGEAAAALPVGGGAERRRQFADEFDLFMRRNGKNTRTWRSAARPRDAPPDMSSCQDMATLPDGRSFSPSRCSLGEEGRDGGIGVGRWQRTEEEEEEEEEELTAVCCGRAEPVLAATWAPISKSECGRAFDGNNSKKILLGMQLARQEREAAAQARMARNLRELQVFVEEFETVRQGVQGLCACLTCMPEEGEECGETFVAAGDPPGRHGRNGRQKKLSFDVDPVSRKIAAQMEENFNSMFRLRNA
eukprot:756138-Hanusia_phi.AAC.1